MVKLDNHDQKIWTKSHPEYPQYSSHFGEVPEAGVKGCSDSTKSGLTSVHSLVRAARLWNNNSCVRRSLASSKWRESISDCVRCIPSARSAKLIDLIGFTRMSTFETRPSPWHWTKLSGKSASHMRKHFLIQALREVDDVLTILIKC